jgi:AraC family transcriptional regulator, melibiose operon regulatory protein
VTKSRGRRSARHTVLQRLDRAADLYLRECYERRSPARGDEFARQLDLTREHLARVATGVLGIPLRDFLRSRQLAYAERLLATTSLSTVQVAEAAAFGTHPTFYRAFKAAYGMTPGQYRQQVTK